VEIGELCVSDIYWQWGARACKRFVVSVPSEGWLHGFLHWDTAAQRFDLNLVGEVVLVQRSGRFATSDWHQVDAHVFAKVEPDVYDLLVLSYSDDVRRHRTILDSLTRSRAIFTRSTITDSSST